MLEKLNIKVHLATKKGMAIELLLFFGIGVSMLPMWITAPLMILISIVSMEVRKIEWHEIGFAFKYFTIKNIIIGLGVAGIYHFVDLYAVQLIADKFAPSHISEVFDMEKSIPKLILGLVASWTTAAFFEEILFRGYLICRLIDLMGDKIVTRIVIVLLNGIIFGFVHAYQGAHGMICTGIIGALQAIVFFAAGKKLAIPIIAHGAFDTIGFTYLFLG